MLRVCGVMVAVFILTLGLAPERAIASVSSLTHTDTCQADGKVQTTFAWQGNDPASLQQWVDLSTQDNGWQPGTFIGAGPFAGSATSYTWSGLLANTPHLVRVNQMFSGGRWDPSLTFTFQTPPCGAAVSGGQGGGSGTAAAPGQECFYRGPLPDANCTPGVIDQSVTQDNIQQTICKSGYTATVRPPTSYTTPLKQQQMVLYGVGNRPTSDFEEDHLISLELGGAPRDARNLFPEPWTGPQNARDKDVVENALHRAVCNGTVPLQAAQRAIASDWTNSLVLLGLKSTSEDGATLEQASTPGDASSGSNAQAGTQPGTTAPATQPATTTQSALPPPPPPANNQSNQSVVPPPIPGVHIWYTSAAPNASVYYCDLDDGWKSLSPANLRSYPTEAALLADFPGRVKSSVSKC